MSSLSFLYLRVCICSVFLSARLWLAVICSSCVVLFSVFFLNLLTISLPHTPHPHINPPHTLPPLPPPPTATPINTLPCHPQLHPMLPPTHTSMPPPKARAALSLAESRLQDAAVEAEEARERKRCLCDQVGSWFGFGLMVRLRVRLIGCFLNVACCCCSLPFYFIYSIYSACLPLLLLLVITCGWQP